MPRQRSPNYNHMTSDHTHLSEGDLGLDGGRTGDKGKWKQVEANEQPGGLWKGKIMKLKTDRLLK